jgi:hypothetical protein
VFERRFIADKNSSFGAEHRVANPKVEQFGFACAMELSTQFAFVARANNSPYGLMVSLFAKDHATITTVAEALEAGTVCQPRCSQHQLCPIQRLEGIWIWH